MEWQLKTMADIAEPVNGIVDGPFGSNLKKSDYIDDSENGIPVLTTKNLHGDYSKDSVRYISKEKYETLKRSTVYPGDILVAKIGSIGTCGIYPLSCKNALIPANLLKITVLPTVDRKYVYYYIQSRGFQEKIKAISTATAQPAFNVTKFRKLHIPIPPLPEQERIVARIEELFSQLDAGVETLKKTKAQLAVYRQAVLKEAFEKLGGTEARLRDLCFFITKGTTPPKSKLYENTGDVPFIKVYNLTFNNSLDFSIDPTFVDRETHQGFLARSIVYPGDVLMNIVGPPMGKVSIVPDTYTEWNINQAIARFRCLDRLNNRFLAYFLGFEGTVERMKKYAKATAGQFNLTLEICRDLTIPVPSLEEQEKAVYEIETKISQCEKIEQTVDTALHQAESMRQSILKDAFEGRL